MKHFTNARDALDATGADGMARLLAAAADITVVLDRQGVVKDLAIGSDELDVKWASAWLGHPWVEAVAAESRPKVEALLREAGGVSPSPRRHVNHPVAGQADVPILYSAVQVGPAGEVVVVGRDLRATAALQQRLIETQQALERDYFRLRHAETRYRLLFQITAEPVVILDAGTRRIAEANPAASELLDKTSSGLVGRALVDDLETNSVATLQAMLHTVRTSGRSEAGRARLVNGTELHVAVSLFRQENSTFFLLRLLPTAADAEAVTPPAKLRLVEAAQHAVDSFVVTDQEGCITSANAAFLDLAQLATEEQALGQSLDRWLGRPGVDLEVLLANLRQHGVVRLFATIVRGEYGASATVELSAATIPHAQPPGMTFTIRDIDLRLAAKPQRGHELPRSVEQLTELVGRVPLKELVRESTDVIERLCIEAALELTQDNRASAADVLGLSRQSLYVKLRRYGLGDLGPEAD